MAAAERAVSGRAVGEACLGPITAGHGRVETASEVAERLGVDRKPLFRAIQRHCVVSPGMSIWLKAMEWGSAESWL